MMTTKSNTCSICEESFPSRNRLFAHIRSQHQDNDDNKSKSHEDDNNRLTESPEKVQQQQQQQQRIRHNGQINPDFDLYYRLQYHEQAGESSQHSSNNNNHLKEWEEACQYWIRPLPLTIRLVTTTTTTSSSSSSSGKHSAAVVQWALNYLQHLALQTQNQQNQNQNQTVLLWQPVKDFPDMYVRRQQQLVYRSKKKENDEDHPYSAENANHHVENDTIPQQSNNSTQQVFLPASHSDLSIAEQRFLADGQDFGWWHRQEVCSSLPPRLLMQQPQQQQQQQQDPLSLVNSKNNNNNNNNNNKTTNNDKLVLDMCAAPGSKTLQLLEENPALLVVNDSNRQRLLLFLHRLRKTTNNNNNNIICKSGVLCMASDGRYLPTLRKWRGYKLHYDAILCDVPCSGDGTLRKQKEKEHLNWTVQLALSLHPLQLSILKRGLLLLQKGGRLVYSTCSLNPIENEAVVAAALRAVSLHGEEEYRLLPIPQQQQQQLMATQEEEASSFGFSHSPGRTTWVVPDPTFSKQNPIVYHSFSEFQQQQQQQQQPPSNGGKKKEASKKKKKNIILPTLFPPSQEDLSKYKKIPLQHCARVLPQHVDDSGGFFLAYIERLPVSYYAVASLVLQKTLEDDNNDNNADDDKKTGQHHHNDPHHGRIYHSVQNPAQLRTLLGIEDSRYNELYHYSGVSTVAAAQAWLRERHSFLPGISDDSIEIPATTTTTVEVAANSKTNINDSNIVTLPSKNAGTTSTTTCCDEETSKTPKEQDNSGEPPVSWKMNGSVRPPPAYTPQFPKPHPELLNEFINFFGLLCDPEQAAEQSVQPFMDPSLIVLTMNGNTNVTTCMNVTTTAETALVANNDLPEQQSQKKNSPYPKKKKKKRQKYMQIGLASRGLASLYTGGAKFTPMEAGLGLCWIPIPPSAVVEKSRMMTNENNSNNHQYYDTKDDNATKQKEMMDEQKEVIEKIDSPRHPPRKRQRRQQQHKASLETESSAKEEPTMSLQPQQTVLLKDASTETATTTTTTTIEAVDEHNDDSCQRQNRNDELVRNDRIGRYCVLDEAAELLAHCATKRVIKLTQSEALLLLEDFCLSVKANETRTESAWMTTTMPKDGHPNDNATKCSSTSVPQSPQRKPKLQEIGHWEPGGVIAICTFATFSEEQQLEQLSAIAHQEGHNKTSNNNSDVEHDGLPLSFYLSCTLTHASTDETCPQQQNDDNMDVVYQLRLLSTGDRRVEPLQRLLKLQLDKH